MWTRTCVPKAKTLQEKFRDMVSARKKENSKNVRATGIMEELSPAQVQIDELMLEQTDFEEENLQKKDDAKAAEGLLTTAGEDVRTQALKRGSRNTASPSPKKKRSKMKTRSSMSG